MPSALYTSLHKKLKEGGSVGASATSQILGTSRRDEHGAALGAIRPSGMSHASFLAPVYCWFDWPDPPC
jgi:hypothetical protein